MATVGKTAHPEEVKAAMAEVAAMLDMYAGDTEALMARGYYRPVERKYQAGRARALRDSANEIRAIEWVEE